MLVSSSFDDRIFVTRLWCILAVTRRISDLGYFIKIQQFKMHSPLIELKKWFCFNDALAFVACDLRGFYYFWYMLPCTETTRKHVKKLRKGILGVGNNFRLHAVVPFFSRPFFRKTVHTILISIAKSFYAQNSPACAVSSKLYDSYGIW